MCKKEEITKSEKEEIIETQNNSLDYFAEQDSAFYNDPMEVNYQQNMNADELAPLHPLPDSTTDLFPVSWLLPEPLPFRR